MKLSSLTAIKNGNASEFKNKKVTDGARVEIELRAWHDPEQVHAVIHFSDVKKMVVNLKNMDMYQYTVEPEDTKIIVVPAFRDGYELVQ